jgi:RimJ/RimL family protein N-acetyltransferase
LRLRPFVVADAPRVRALAGDERIADVTAHIPHPYPESLASEWIASHAAQHAAGRAQIMAITLSENGELIGAVSAQDIHQGCGELGYWIGVPYWGQGYATEAVSALVQEVFASGRVQRLQARVLVRNPGSARVLEKAGFSRSGEGMSVCGYRCRSEPVLHFEHPGSAARG